jgi:hypothetical protein
MIVEMVAVETANVHNDNIVRNKGGRSSASGLLPPPPPVMVRAVAVVVTRFPLPLEDSNPKEAEVINASRASSSKVINMVNHNSNTKDTSRLVVVVVTPTDDMEETEVSSNNNVSLPDKEDGVSGSLLHNSSHMLLRLQ